MPQTKIGSGFVATGAVGPTSLSTGAPYWDTSGNAMIGTTTANGKLNVAGGNIYNTTSATGSTGFYTYNGTNVGAAISVDFSGPYTFYDFRGQLNLRDTNASYANRMFIDGFGNVGIGTSSPTRLVTLGGSGDQYINRSSDTGSLILCGGIGINSGASQFSGAFVARGGTSSYNQGGVEIYTNAQERMRIDTSGNLMVGTTGTIAGAKSSFYQNNAGGSWAGFFQTQNGTGCVGTTNVSGTASYTAVGFYNNGTSFSSCGSIAVSGTTTSYNTSSDYRLKENVQPITTGLAKISALKPVTYDWISDKSEGEGFIAHELQSVIPLAVTGEKDAVDDDGKIIPQGVDYSKIVVHLVAAIQELTAKVTALEAKVGP